MKKTLLLLIIAVTLTACGQETTDEYGCIYGVVMSNASLEPLHGATVKLERNGAVVRSASTFDDGSYEFTNLEPSSNYILYAEYRNHYEESCRVRIESGVIARMDIYLTKIYSGINSPL